MKIRFLTVGKCKEAYLRDAASEYLKRLSRFAEVSVLEVQDEKTADGASDAENERVKALEGARLLQKIKDRDHVIALALDGKAYDSIEGSASARGRALVLLAAHISAHADACHRAGTAVPLLQDPFGGALPQVMKGGRSSAR